jgi:hypothetical protein
MLGRGMFRVGLAMAIPATIYTGSVCARDRDRATMLFDESQYAVGTTNYQMLDELQTGDIVLFSRKWYGLLW